LSSIPPATRLRSIAETTSNLGAEWFDLGTKAREFPDDD
jgi:hypothetical protein